MSKHTAGTWMYNPNFSAVVVIHDHKVKAVADFGKCDLPETSANALLIAAAPELLVHLETLIRAIDRLPGNNPLEGLADKARDAITKAKGE